ncbi:MAG: NosD domain-containing protein, partial [Halanaerobiales bacterium]
IKLKIKSVGKGADKYKVIRYVEDEGEYIQDHETTWYGREELEKNDYYIVDDHNLEPRTTYRYRVKTKNSSKQEYDWKTRLSNETEITLKNNPPQPGDVIRPAEGAILEVLQDEEIELAVEPFRDPDGDELDYEFVVEQNNQGTWEEIHPSGEKIVEGEAVKLMLSEGLHQGEYRWRVRASDGEETTQNDYHYFDVEWLESPEISWPGNDRSIYKGEEISLTVEFTDPDKVIEKYEVDYGDGNIESGDHPGDELEISHHYETLSGEEGFPLSVTLQDAGGEITEEINIFVTNTLSGSLRMNEQWSGKMELEDDVIVPQGKTLIINSGTEVIFPSGSALKVRGSLTVSGTSNNRIQFKSEDKEPGNWAGIFVAEEAEAPEIYYAVIKYAHKGLTLVTKNKGEIENTEFQDNLVGLHLYGSSPDILSSDFFNNELYGIKEDKDCQPYLEGNTFQSNQIADYYDSELTELSQDELEEIK